MEGDCDEVSGGVVSGVSLAWGGGGVMYSETLLMAMLIV